MLSVSALMYHSRVILKLSFCLPKLTQLSLAHLNLYTKSIIQGKQYDLHFDENILYCTITSTVKQNSGDNNKVNLSKKSINIEINLSLDLSFPTLLLEATPVLYRYQFANYRKWDNSPSTTTINYFFRTIVTLSMVMQWYHIFPPKWGKEVALIRQIKGSRLSWACFL